MKIDIRVTMLCAAVVGIGVFVPSTDAVAQRGSDRNNVRVHVAPPAVHPRSGNSYGGRHARVSPDRARGARLGARNQRLYNGARYQRFGNGARYQRFGNGARYQRFYGARHQRFYNAAFYWPRRQGLHVGVRVPFGTRVRHLSPGYVSFGLGSHRYFYSDFTYYLQDSRTREYVVVQEPSGAEAAVISADQSGSGEIFVYPNLGQSNEQRDRDRYECYLWAVEQTSFDPGAANPDMERAGDHRRARSACLEGRGYTVK